MIFVLTLTEHINVLETHWDTIVQKMKNPDGIMSHLLRTNILNEVDVRVIYREETKSDKIEALLSILIRKPDSAFKGLSDALREDDQRHLVTRLGNLFANCFNLLLYNSFC